MGNTTYNGWKNHATWNVALWLSNDEALYDLMRESADYESLRDALRDMGVVETPDHVSYSDSALDVAALDEMIAEDKS